MTIIVPTLVTKKITKLSLIVQTIVDAFAGQNENLVQNGEFITDTDWSKSGGWTISAGVAHNDGTIGNLLQVINI